MRQVQPWLRSWASHVIPPTKDENGNQVIVVPHDAGAGRERGRRHLEVELKRRCDEHVLQSDSSMESSRLRTGATPWIKPKNEDVTLPGGLVPADRRLLRGDPGASWRAGCLTLFTNNFDKINPNDFVVAVLT